MPYKSKKQAAYIHAEAERGTPWAKKFVKDSEGTHVQPPKAKKKPHGRPKGRLKRRHRPPKG